MTRVALLGLPWNEHSSFLRGAALAPPAIRAALRSRAARVAAKLARELAARLLGD